MVATCTPIVLPFSAGERDPRAGVAHLGERAVLHDREGGGRTGVGHREIDHLQAFGGNAHARHDRVILAGDQAGDDAVPVLGDEVAGDLQPVAQIIGQINLEADQLAVRRVHVVRRIGALGGDHDLFPVLGLGGRHRQPCQHRHGDRDARPEISHIHSPSFGPR
jgi:hypothetical protein